MTRTALIVGASRGLGRAIATDLAARGWNVIGTVRGSETIDGITVEHLDVTEPAQLAPLRDRLPELDLLFVNAGTTTREDTPIGEVSTEEFVRVMVTNSLSPLRVIDALAERVVPDGLIGVMSSGQGSITNNTKGLREVYRGSKAALNMFMRSYAARQPERALVIIAPGWIRTELGGPEAPFTIEENVPKVVDVLESRLGKAGLEYLDYSGATVPW
ncbi:SDR family NAD(P)-dependent oxidoreductase [Cryptosporangium sp. NPDC048952]|uniref:SDR family NAD(P)-dependent oxidoreductase n=1 Tax=Cryptosporangium sp. NPDC048952 TaxID=3363961 RepID=UPI0037134B5F